MIRVLKTSPFSGKVNMMEFNMDDKEFEERFAKWNSGTLIQEAFDNLSADEREFLMTGIMPDEWPGEFE